MFLTLQCFHLTDAIVSLILEIVLMPSYLIEEKDFIVNESKTNNLDEIKAKSKFISDH